MNKNQQVDISLVFFFIAFCIVIFGLLSKVLFKSNSPLIQTKQTATTILSLQKSSPVLKKLDYNLPIECSYTTKQTSVSATIKDTSIAVFIVDSKGTQNYIVEGDCMYSWIEKEKMGLKKCGVGQYIGMGRQLLGSGLISLDSLNNLVKQTGKNIPLDIGSVLESCKNVQEVKKEVFVIPKNVVFGE